MKNRIAPLALIAAFIAVGALFGGYVTKVYIENGGNKLVVESGGEIEIKSGGTLDLQSGALAPALDGYALLAGDADGQVIQGSTGAEKARVDIGVYNSAAVTLFDSGATPASVVATDSSGGIYSGDGSSNMAVDSDYGEVNTGSGPFSLSVGSLNIVSSQTPPTNADDACTTGDTIDTATFHYYCAATNTWVRVALATWP